MNASNTELLEEEILRLNETGQVLVRGREEIARRLLAARNRGVFFTTAGPGGSERRFRLLDVDGEGGLLHFVEELFGVTAREDGDDGAWITFSCACVSGRAEFVTAVTEAVELSNCYSIRTTFPDAILLYQDRTLERVPAVSDAWLEWEFGTGHATFRARLIDVGLGGTGAMLLEPGLCLDPGMRLKARFVRKGMPPVEVDLEVRFSRPVLLGDGGRATRVGFRFLEAPCALESLRAAR
jgi:hypothetical protein